MNTTTKATFTDAVILIPGIMGSELVDSASHDVLWGLSDPRWYVAAWTHGTGLDRLVVTESERNGDTSRVVARRLLSAPAALPVLHGVEPYGRLLRALQRAAAHPDAVRPFPYDWRLSVEHNAALLGRAIAEHLDSWQRHTYWAQAHGNAGQAGVVIVAHSMGGLVAQRYLDSAGAGSPVRTLVTLGTPFYGAVKTLEMLSSGRQRGLPHRRLRDLARTLPGVYDLLPTYRCVLAPSAARRLVVSDVVSIGGDPGLARAVLDKVPTPLKLGGAALRSYVGVDQPTTQSVRLANGEAQGLHYIVDDDGQVDHAGDGTVFRKSATVPATQAAYIPQTHTALARADEAIAYVRSVLTEGSFIALPSAVPIGVDVPDVVAVGEEFAVGVTTAADASALSCSVTEIGPNVAIEPPHWNERDGRLQARLRLERPGIYRVDVKSGGYSPISQLLLVVPPVGMARTP